MSLETETIFHADRSDDESAKVRHHDNDDFWVVESYQARTTKVMIEMGAIELPSRIDGKLFKVNAKQLIEFIAAENGLVVEFRKHKKRQLSDETKAKLAERLRGLRQQQKV